MLRQLRLTFGFFTILPVPGNGSLADIAAAAYLLPLVAVTLGVAEGLAAVGFVRLFGSLLSAALVLSLALLATGFHHSDGVGDVADAIMARGDPERRRRVLKDSTMGTGAVGALLLTYMVSWAALAEAMALLDGGELLAVLVTVEVAARLCMLMVATLSDPSHRGSGSVFIAALKGWRGGAGLGVSIALLVLLAIYLPLVAMLAGTAVVVAAFLIIALSASWFGGAGGDVLGASVEWGRMAALLGVAVAINL